jgi:WD40 repeat protein
MAELERTLQGHANTVRSVCVSADGSRLFSGSDDNTIKVWDVATGACVQTLQGHAEWVWSVCVLADGSRLFSGS